VHTPSAFLGATIKKDRVIKGRRVYRARGVCGVSNKGKKDQLVHAAVLRQVGR